MLKVEAAAIAALGYAVFPCANPLTDTAEVGKKGKRPLTENGVDDATADLQQISTWAAKFPDANIGVKCSNCIVLDVDNKNGKTGSQDIKTISTELGILYPTSIAKTGTGGFHLFFAKPTIETVAKTGVIWDGKKTGIDIRCNSTYIIAPPSLHENGNRYEWLRPLVSPYQLDPLPQAWIDRFLPRQPIRTTSCLPPIPAGNFAVDCCQKYVDKIEPLQKGGRNNGIWRIAQEVFWDFGLSETEGFPILQHFNARCLPPLTDAEIIRAMKRVSELGSEKERGWRVQESHLLQIRPKADISSLVNPLPTLDDTHVPVIYPWQPFPTHLLPATVARFIREVAKANCCNEASVALSALVALAAAIGNSRWIEVKKGWKHPPMLWAILIGKAGTVKTWAINPPIRPLQVRQDRNYAKYQYELKQWNSERAEYNRLSPAEKRHAQIPNAEPPTLARILSKEGTPEKMIQNCSENPHGFLIHADEMKTFVGSFDAYKSNSKTSNAESLYCTLFNGGGLDQERVGGDRYAPHAFVCIQGSIQPAIARKCFSAESYQSGFLARFLVVMPPHQIARASEFEVSDETEQAYSDLINALLDLQGPQTIHEWTPDNISLAEPELTLTLRLTPEAKEVWWKAYEQTADEMEHCQNERMLSAYEKNRVYAARFALVLHVAKQVEQRIRLAANDAQDAPWDRTEKLIGDEIDAESMTNAIKLANWFKYEIKRCYATNWGFCDEDVTIEVDELHQRIIDHIDRNGGQCEYRKLSHSLRRAGGETVKSALEQMVRHNMIQIDQEKSNKGPARKIVKRIG